jgi:hypothetical protein
LKLGSRCHASLIIKKLVVDRRHAYESCGKQTIEIGVEMNE